MRIPTTLRFKVHVTDGANDVSIGFDLVQEKTFLVLKVFVTFVAVVVVWGVGLVLSHLGHGFEGEVATHVGAGNSSRGVWPGHFDVMSRYRMG